MARKRKKPGYSKAIWAAVKADYELGIYSVRFLAEKHGPSEGAIRLRAKTEGWQHHFAMHVEARRQARMLPVPVIDLRAQGTQAPPDPTPEQEAAIDDAARTQIAVVLAHRKDIRRTADVVRSLIDELRGQTFNADAIAELIEVVFSSPTPADAANRMALKRMLSLSNRATTAVNLVNAMGRLATLERQAFGLGNLESEPPQDPMKRKQTEEDNASGRVLTDHERAVMILDAMERAERQKQNAPGTDTTQ